MKLQNQIALVTGANRGIGKEIVGKLLEAGVAKVYAGARDTASLSNAIALDPERVSPLQIDVTEAAQVNALAAQAPDVTLLVNNAGVLDFGGLIDAESSALERNFSVNFSGALNMTRAFAPVIEHNGGGAVVNMLTLVALASMPGLAIYNASKAAAWSMTQSLRAELAARRIAVFGVFPGAVDTDMLAGVEMPKTAPADVANAIVAGLAADSEDIFPDPMSAQMYAAWKADHKAVEKQFATM